MPSQIVGHLHKIEDAFTKSKMPSQIVGHLHKIEDAFTKS
jgi:hypothetical protein